MNMLLHGVKDAKFEIDPGDTLTNDRDMLREKNGDTQKASGAASARRGLARNTSASRLDARQTLSASCVKVQK